jgi:3-hydroxybutyryl-CoA dehydrogenase
MCSLLREAFFLVQNKYADIEDIDRACRNDAGYYLSFAGNFRYMDLMGLYAYGVVMNDLNAELSKETKPPAFFNDMMKRKDYGMNTGKGFYEYSEEEASKLGEEFEKFSFEIDKIIRKYPFVPQGGPHPGDRN